jgi:hypothetical protein
LRRHQRGYLYEIPAILLLLLLALALIVPRLPAVARRVVLGLAIIPILCCLFYILARPAWTNAAGDPGRRYGRLGWFLACAVAVLAVVAALIAR